MIDYRLQTFLLLCEELNYTETARKLHITQPNVSQHIRFLEEYYDVKLFRYKNRKLYITDEGQKLRRMAVRLKSESTKIKKEMDAIEDKRIKINFGSTLTIGEYIMPDIISKIDFSRYSISMIVENTQSLLQKLEEGIIDFAIIEGHFNKVKYDSLLFSKEKFVAIASQNLKEENSEHTLNDLLKYRLILREKGSGTREVFERILFDNNLSPQSFSDVIEIGNMNTIKSLVAKDVGISFLYKNALLKTDGVKEIKIKGINIEREFNFVMMKNSYEREKNIEIYSMLKNIYNQNKGEDI